MSRTATASNFKVSACVAEHIGDRTDQQDRVAILTSPHYPGALMALLADGMGGRSGGRIASDQVLATAKSLFQELPERGSTLRGMLGQIASEAHAVIRLTALASEKEPHSTLVALIVSRDSAVWVHAGDSRLYHFRDGILEHKTIDHSFGSQLDAEGQLVEGGPETERFKNILFSAIGIGHELRLDYGEVLDLRPGDSFVLASDGLWAYFSEREIGAIVHHYAVRDAAESLVRLARDRAKGGGDNLSVAIVKLTRAERPPDSTAAD
ncbi:MAG TPA: PP2C family serine/threonine-protein phosphatase [Burkholderiaceae bacterium]|nr:PP2C family serine/threonine-protein phosphatase [Burkholderiaceae bacterium]